MTIADLRLIPGRVYPARRWTRALAGQGGQPLAPLGFALGYVVLEARGGQVPWHRHDQEEVYFVIEGRGEICVDRERSEISSGQAVYLPPGKFHQLTNTGDAPMIMIYTYAPGGDVAHWRQELDGTLPRAGVEAPALPAGARPQQHGRDKG